MHILFIGNQERSEIKKIVDYAEKNIVRFESLFNGPIGDNKNYVCCFSGYKCVYSVEENKNNIMCKHLSVSLNPFVKGKLPSVESVVMIMNEFGILGSFHNIDQVFDDVDRVWIEHIDQKPVAVNILKIVETEEVLTKN